MILGENKCIGLLKTHLVEGNMSQWSQEAILKNPEAESKEMQTQWDSSGYKQYAAPMQWFPAGTMVEKQTQTKADAAFSSSQ